MKKNTVPFTFLLIAMLFCHSFTSFAQVPDPCEDPAAPCPIDSNIVVFIVVALVIAAKKTYSYKKKALTANF